MDEPVEEHELSALIDGELDPLRAAQVRSRLEQDTALRASFDRLAALDAAWTGLAQASCFTPSLRLDPESASARINPRTLAVVILALMTGRLAAKTIPVDVVAGLLIHVFMLILALALLVWIVDRCGDQPEYRLSN